MRFGHCHRGLSTCNWDMQWTFPSCTQIPLLVNYCLSFFLIPFISNLWIKRAVYLDLVDRFESFPTVYGNPRSDRVCTGYVRTVSNQMGVLVLARNTAGIPYLWRHRGFLWEFPNYGVIMGFPMPFPWHHNGCNVSLAGLNSCLKLGADFYENIYVWCFKVVFL